MEKHKTSVTELFQLFFGPSITVTSLIIFSITRNNRHAFGTLIGEHNSGFFGSSALIFLIVLVCRVFNQQAKEEDIKSLELLTKIIPIISIVLIFLFNLYFENLAQARFEEFFGDMTGATLGILLTYLGMNFSLNKFYEY